MRELWWGVIKFIELLGCHEYIARSFTVGASACALGVSGKRGVPVDGAATAVLAWAWCFAQYDRSISKPALQTAASAFIKHA